MLSIYHNLLLGMHYYVPLNVLYLLAIGLNHYTLRS